MTYFVLVDILILLIHKCGSLRYQNFLHHMRATRHTVPSIHLLIAVL